MKIFFLYLNIGLSAVFAGFTTQNIFAFFAVMFGLHAVCDIVDLAKEDIIKNIKK